jgi:hypothetical protein
MMPLTFMQREESKLLLRAGIGSVDDLAPGRNPALDLICDGILSGSPFVYPAEELGLHDA